LQKLPEEKQEYYAKEVYKNGFSLELLKSIKEGKTIKEHVSSPALPSLPKTKEKISESLPEIIKRIEPSIVSVFTYDKKGNILRLGSGFFISQNGDIITNYHVLQGASSAEVKTSDGKTYPITYIVAEDEQSDIIRLSVNISSQYVYPLSLSTTIPEVGERIIIYGSPLGLEKTVSDGIVSAIREVPGYGKLIQITAPISPGSSGSPVLNMKGEVIGIATFQMVEGQNLNFAIPSERIANLNLIEEEKTFTTEELFEQEEKDKKDSDYAYEAYNRALYFMDKKEYGKAIPYLEIANKTDILSLKANVYCAIGFCYSIEFGLYNKAIESFKQAIRIDPDNAGAYTFLGIQYVELGRYKEAIEPLKQAIRLSNYYIISAYDNLGFAYYELGRYKDAIESSKQSIRIDPDHAYTHWILGVSYVMISDKNSALNEYKILKNLDIDLANKLFDLIY
jgi:tetratricopeptide (TPR) repeat protein